jgi:nifR3 family TIM-barrel protein
MPKIGSENFPNVFLAPLSGCSDLAFRLIAREHGARFCFFEMIDANSLHCARKNGLARFPKSKSLSLLKTVPQDRPIAAQLVGRDPEAMLGAAAIICRESPRISFLDINAACPAKKVIRKKAGAYLLNDAAQLADIIKKLSSGLPVPVTVKLRTGYDRKDPAATAKIAKKCESSGASALFVHARTGAQMYSGEIDNESLRAVKDAVRIPVFGSGNIFTAADAKNMMDETGCDGIMVARGALGNPWIFKEMEKLLTPNGNNPPSSNRIPPKASCPASDSRAHFNNMHVREERKGVLKRHLAYIERYKDCGQSGKVGCMRKTFLWYTKGLPNARGLRARACLVKSYDEIIRLAETL